MRLETDEVADALTSSLIAENELDYSGTTEANVVDGLFLIGRALQSIAESLERIANNHGIDRKPDRR